MRHLLQRHRPRQQRGTVVRGALVLAGVVGALLLQSASPAWQSRLDAYAVAFGLPVAKCLTTHAASASAANAGMPAQALSAARYSGLAPAI